jgi:putative FmdB family regulatory protein
MPRYEYRCEQCGETFVVKQKFVDDPLTVHETCGGKVERLISVPALQFKGTGWYVTDYGRNHTPTSSSGSNGQSEGKSEKSDSKSSETKSEAKTESKSESKPAPKPPSGDK